MTAEDLSIRRIPVLPVRDRIVFPSTHAPLIVGRPRSIEAVQRAMGGDRLIFITAQRHVQVEEPSRNDLYEYGTLAEALQTIHMPDGMLRVRVLGRQRARLMDLTLEQGTLLGDIQYMTTPSLSNEEGLQLEALRRMLLRKFDEYVKKVGRIPIDLVASAEKQTSLDVLADTVADALYISIEEKQELLEIATIPKRLSRIVEILDSEIEILNIERKIQTRVHRQIEKNQKEYYLNEQMRAIQKELKKKDDNAQEIDAIREKIKAAKMTEEAQELALKEADRLEKMMPFSPEATVVRGYLDCMISMPWSTVSKDNTDVAHAKTILDEDHFGLDKPKERLLEYMAVLKLTKTIKGPVLCFVGPPGVGKTSLAKSLARAMGREFSRISLGGVRDESEIRGHRRTYIGSMPGRIVQALRKTKTKNPVILLDEIDKMGTDWRGDPSAALLEVLDPEQNKSFVDHFLDVGFDVSQVIFITTANSLYTIPATLQDRMEVLRFSAYTTDEKIHIARQFLLRKELKEHGMSNITLKLEDETLRKLIHSYTQEAGVRALQRKIAQICRKVAVDLSKSKHSTAKKTISIGLADLATYLGVPEFHREKTPANAVGISTGLAWTEHGGETLTIEVTSMPGAGKVQLTGKLGSVMQESAQTALSLVKSRGEKWGVRAQALPKTDLHVHVPEGAVPKDGPSAGIAMATALVSALSGKAVRSDVAMTGEVTLRGRVLAIGGLKEKVIAAQRDGMKVILYPRGNEKDISEIPENVRKSLQLIAVDDIDQVFEHALLSVPVKSASASRKSNQISRSH